MFTEPSVLTLRALKEFSKVMQTLDYVSGLHNCCMSRILSTLLEFRWVYVNTEKVVYCLTVFGGQYNSLCMKIFHNIKTQNCDSRKHLLDFFFFGSIDRNSPHFYEIHNKIRSFRVRAFHKLPGNFSYVEQLFSLISSNFLHSEQCLVFHQIWQIGAAFRA